MYQNITPDSNYLTDEELEIMRQHPHIAGGFRRLKGKPGFSPGIAALEAARNLNQPSRVKAMQ